MSREILFGGLDDYLNGLFYTALIDTGFLADRQLTPYLTLGAHTTRTLPRPHLLSFNLTS